MLECIDIIKCFEEIEVVEVCTYNGDEKHQNNPTLHELLQA